MNCSPAETPRRSTTLLYITLRELPPCVTAAACGSPLSFGCCSPRWRTTMLLRGRGCVRMALSATIRCHTPWHHSMKGICEELGILQTTRDQKRAISNFNEPFLRRYFGAHQWPWRGCRSVWRCDGNAVTPSSPPPIFSYASGDYSSFIINYK